MYLWSSYAEVAQSVEQGTENPRVGSSILSLGTSISSTYDIYRRCFFRLRVPKTGTIRLGRKSNLMISCQNFLKIWGLQFPVPMSTAGFEPVYLLGTEWMSI